ncbi:serine hydrolase [uncultured Sphingomonas sp.]|uniref:serine hydrolase domain-containing protein n=1 Tax=uncultured Sphingomonas sp. TaxID=158754 RepID=UPI0025EF837C|nr:serine hydrolase [uncultured Sphingomonas sp.]
MTKYLLAATAIFLLAPGAAAQEDRPAYVRALAAGYKASFICSNLFNGGISEQQTVADDLRGTYSNLNPIFPTLAATIDRERRTVSVPYDPAMPPRIAAWRPGLGCTQLPIGASTEAISTLPQLGVKPPNFDSKPWPMGDRQATALPSGDAAAIGRVTANAFDRRTYGQGSETTAVLVVEKGRIVSERYRRDLNMHSSQRTWSVGKSIAGTIIGAATQQGVLDVKAPAPVPEWQRPGDPRRAITTDQLLRMASGLNSDHAGNRTDALYFGGIGVADQAGGWPLVAPPGTAFRYANNDTVLAIRGLQHVLRDGGRSLRFPFEALLWKIGMTRTVPETDWRGHFILSSQVWTTARDLARLGLLHLHDGVWNGERILPAGWTGYVRSHGPAQPSSGFGYGATWWTFPKESGLPQDAIVAQGNRGQYVVVIPSRSTVIVRRGFDATGMNFDLAQFTSDLLRAFG